MLPSSITSSLRPTLLALLAVSAIVAVSHSAANAEDKSPPSIEYRDTNPAIDTVDSIRVLSTSKAKELQTVVQAAYVKLAPSVVRILKIDTQGKVSKGNFCGVIIDPAGLVLTCAHHDLAPQTNVKFELSDGRQVTGKMLGKFDDQDRVATHVGISPDLGLAVITEPGNWPAVAVDQSALPADCRTCLAIGYPGSLPLGRPPVLRAGHIVPTIPDWPLIYATTTSLPGDSGSPLFDVQGRLLGVLWGSDGPNCVRYQSIAPLKEYRDRLQAGEIISAPVKRYRGLRGRPSIAAPFAPALDLEDRVQQVNKNMIQLMDGPHVLATGLIVDVDGWAVTKASLIGTRETWTCRVFYVRNNKSFIKGRVLAKSPEHDLALLKLDAGDWFPVSWTDADPKVGTFVAPVLGRTTGVPLQFGVVAATVAEEIDRQSVIPQIPLTLLSGTTESNAEPVIDLNAWRTAEFDIYRHLLEDGDVITHLNGIATPTRGDFGKVADRLSYARKAEDDGVDYGKPLPGIFHGDWVRVGIRRGPTELTVAVPRIHSVTQGALNWHSHPLSLRRESFPAVFAHDCVLRPEQCGGPVVDLDGKVTGLNIARADEIRTLAIPAAVLQAVIRELRKQADASGKS